MGLSILELEKSKQPPNQLLWLAVARELEFTGPVQTSQWDEGK